MTKSQEDYVSMTLTVDAVVDEYAELWQGNVPFTNIMNQLNENNNDITDN